MIIKKETITDFIGLIFGGLIGYTLSIIYTITFEEIFIKLGYLTFRANFLQLLLPTDDVIRPVYVISSVIGSLIGLSYQENRKLTIILLFILISYYLLHFGYWFMFAFLLSP